MNFVTPEFAVFFFVVLALVRLCSTGGPAAFGPVLLVANLVFYATAGIIFVPLLLTVAALNWGAGRLMHGAQPNQRRLWISLSVAGNVSLLAFFKYYEFFLTTVESLLGGLGFLAATTGMLELAFPVGLSFYTFQGLAYAIDQYRTPERDPESLYRVLLFVSFFPTIMAGPILRPHQFLPQFDTLRPPDKDDVAEGCTLIVSGLFKKVVLASFLSEQVVRDVFQTPELFSSWAVLIAVYGYSLQIWCDFSGYSDMAIGFARLLGFKLPANFRSPYLALNLQDFWRRWHITLSSWLRDYLYIPLGGSRHGSRTANLIITMLLGGMWHGSHLRFLIWGFMHGLGLAVVHGFQHLTRHWSEASLLFWSRLRWLTTLLSWLLTFHFVTLLWIFFRADDLPRALEIISRMLHFGLPGQGFTALAIPAILCGLVLQLIGTRIAAFFTHLQVHLPWPLQTLLLAVVCGFILRMGPDGVLPFIYFQF